MLWGLHTERGLTQTLYHCSFQSRRVIRQNLPVQDFVPAPAASTAQQESFSDTSSRLGGHSSVKKNVCLALMDWVCFLQHLSCVSRTVNDQSSGGTVYIGDKFSTHK